MGWFSDTKNKVSFPWNSLESITQWNSIWEDQSNKSVLIFKHSTRCGISSMALKSFEQEMATDSEIELLFLDLIKFREISNEIAEATGVMHQSPQVLVIQSGKVLYSESHHSIDAVKILKTLGI